MSEQWTIGSILQWTRQYFAGKGVDNPRLDAEVLLSHILDQDRLHLYVHFDQPLSKEELTAFREAVKQRAMRQPVAYITGRKEFMGMTFRVTPDVLIPRPDTEILVETVAELLKETPQPRILDIGTGSGAIIVSLLAALPSATGVAVDISDKALAVARQNAIEQLVADRLALLCGDVLAPVQGQLFEAIVSNPPYIPAADIAGLEPEVRREPLLALDGGRDGLDFYRHIVQEGAACLTPGGVIAVEVGAGQAQAVAALAVPATRLIYERTVKDYGNIERVVIFRHRGDREK